MKSNWLLLIPLCACLLFTACDEPTKIGDADSGGESTTKKDSDEGTTKAPVAKESKSVASPKPEDVASLEEGLEPGSMAPEISGEDLDGEVFSLSDYRGKVVMLDFWGDW